MVWCPSDVPCLSCKGTENQRDKSETGAQDAVTTHSPKILPPPKRRLNRQRASIHVTAVPEAHSSLCP